MAPHSSTLAWKIPWTEEPGGLQSMGSLRVGHDWATSLSLLTFMHWRRMATHSSVLAWRIPGTGEPGGLPSMGSHRVGHDWSNLAAAGEQIQPGVIMFMPIASPLCVVGGVQLADCSMMGFSPLRWVFPSSCLHFGQLWIYKLFSSNRRKVKCELVSFSS